MRKSILLITIILCLAACKSNDTVVPIPGKAALVFPAQNALCTTGTAVSNTQSTISLSWNSSSNTDSYEVNIKNLLTGTTTTQSTTNTTLDISLLRNTPYSWSVTSKSSSSASTTQSDVWKFYNAGLGVTYYAPFPAVLVSPKYGQNLTATTTVDLTWTGSSVDNNITGYDLYFGTSSTPPLFKSDVNTTSVNNVAVTSGTTYFWKIVTKDSQGNNSTSDTYNFTLN